MFARCTLLHSWPGSEVVRRGPNEVFLELYAPADEDKVIITGHLLHPRVEVRSDGRAACIPI